MHKLHRQCLLSTFALSVLVIITTATFYEEEDVEVTQESVLKRWSSISKSTCILRCRRNKDCLHAAMDGFDCLFLKNESSNDVSHAKEKISVIRLKEVDTKKKPPPGIVISVIIKIKGTSLLRYTIC